MPRAYRVFGFTTNIILHSRKNPDREKIVRFFECNEFIIFQLSTLCSWIKDKLQMGFAQITKVAKKNQRINDKTYNYIQYSLLTVPKTATVVW